MDTVVSAPVVSAEEARKRHVRASDLVACNLAFIDCKKPGSHLKQNFSIIGAGVTQSADQVVNLTDAHGFQLGAAGMPGGITNNLHIHYTAEVFMVFEGSWVFRWGDQGKDGEIPGGSCDIVSVPTWIFRGFSNTGTSAKPEMIFTALGGDDTGGIIWHPDIVKEAGTFGLHLTRDNMMVDTTTGAKKPADKDLMPLISDADRAKLRKYSVAEMRNRIVSSAERAWLKRALLCTVLPGHAVEIAPVIGHGMSEDRDTVPKINNPHGFSVEWLKIPPGQSLARHRIGPKQVLIVFKGSAALTFNAAGNTTAIEIGPKDTVSVPAAAWRQIANTGAGDVEIAVITTGDGKKYIEWAPDVLRAARTAGYALDHSGYLAPLHLLPMSVQMSA
jgi:mannose-6-phosphate isomerase-like protein (cupin superfamily)